MSIHRSTVSMILAGLWLCTPGVWSEAQTDAGTSFGGKSGDHVHMLVANGGEDTAFLELLFGILTDRF